MLYLPLLGETNVLPLTRTLGQLISPVRAELPNLWKHFVCQKRGFQKMTFLLSVLQISRFYASGWFEVLHRNHIISKLQQRSGESV